MLPRLERQRTASGTVFVPHYAMSGGTLMKNDGVPLTPVRTPLTKSAFSLSAQIANIRATRHDRLFRETKGEIPRS